MFMLVDLYYFNLRLQFHYFLIKHASVWCYPSFITMKSAPKEKEGWHLNYAEIIFCLLFFKCWAVFFIIPPISCGSFLSFAYFWIFDCQTLVFCYLFLQQCVVPGVIFFAYSSRNTLIEFGDWNAYTSTVNWMKFHCEISQVINIQWRGEQKVLSTVTASSALLYAYSHWLGP